MSNLYSTSDLNLAAFLRAKHNLKLDRVESSKEDSRRAFFIFKTQGMSMSAAIEGYYKEEEVSALRLVREVDSLKSMARNLIRV